MLTHLVDPSKCGCRDGKPCRLCVKEARRRGLSLPLSAVRKSCGGCGGGTPQKVRAAVPDYGYGGDIDLPPFIPGPHGPLPIPIPNPRWQPPPDIDPDPLVILAPLIAATIL